MKIDKTFEIIQANNKLYLRSRGLYLKDQDSIVST
jgi:hypothetical protein